MKMNCKYFLSKEQKIIAAGFNKEQKLMIGSLLKPLLNVLSVDFKCLYQLCGYHHEKNRYISRASNHGPIPFHKIFAHNQRVIISAFQKILIAYS